MIKLSQEAEGDLFQAALSIIRSLWRLQFSFNHHHRNYFLRHRVRMLCVVAAMFLFTPAAAMMSATEGLFCVQGRMAPRILLIGAQKGGTTSLTTDLLNHLPISCGFTLTGEPRKLWKEKHFFDGGQCKFHADACFFNGTKKGVGDIDAPFAGDAIFGRERAMRRYLEHFPRCNSGLDGRKLVEVHSTNKRASLTGYKGRLDQRSDSQPSDRPLPAGSVTMDATPRYLRMPLAPLRVMTMYGTAMAQSTTIVTILRDPEERAWSWFRFFALNAQDGKDWARSQLDNHFWFHFNDASFRRWVRAQIEKRSDCKRRGIATRNMWPDCDSETGMFGGLYAAQLRRWLDAGFRLSQLVVVPLDCYSSEGPTKALRLISRLAGLPTKSFGHSISDLDSTFTPENSKRLKRVAEEQQKGKGKKNHNKGNNKQASGTDASVSAAVMNNHRDKGIPVGARKALATFFKHDLEDLRELLGAAFSSSSSPSAARRNVHVVDCAQCHFLKPCNETTCLPTFEERIRKIDADEQAWAEFHRVEKSKRESRNSLLEHSITTRTERSTNAADDDVSLGDMLIQMMRDDDSEHSTNASDREVR